MKKVEVKAIVGETVLFNDSGANGRFRVGKVFQVRLGDGYTEYVIDCDGEEYVMPDSEVLVTKKEALEAANDMIDYQKEMMAAKQEDCSIMIKKHFSKPKSK